MSCKVPSLLDKEKEEKEQKESVLYQALVDAMGDEDLARKRFDKCSGNRFLKDFGDYKSAHGSGYSADANLSAQNKFAPRTYDNGEPRLFRKAIYKQNSKGENTSLIEYSQYYFMLENGSKDFIDKVRFPGMDADDIDEVGKYLLYAFVTENPDTNLEDLASLPKKTIVESIETAMNSYIGQNSEDPDLVRRGEIVLRSKEDFKEEIIDKLNDLGVKYKQTIVNDKTGLPEEGEVPEGSAGGGLNMKESFEKDPKETMATKMKVMLSQLPDMKLNEEFDAATDRLMQKSKFSKFNDTALNGLRRAVNNGQVFPTLTEEDIADLKIPRLVDKPGKFLGKQSFVEFDIVHKDLMKELSDIVSYNTGGNMSDIMALMTKRIDDIKFVKPWAFQLLAKINEMKTLEQKAQFVQAFAKVELNFYVTEYNKGKKDYKVYNATSTNSKDSQLRGNWNMNFRNQYLVDGKLTPNGLAILEGLEDDLKQLEIAVSEDIRAAIRRDDAIPGLAITHQLSAINSGAEDVIEILNKVGAVLDLGDFQAHVKRSGGDEKAYDELKFIFNGAIYMMDYMTKPETKFTEKGESINPFDNQDAIKALSKAQALFRPDMADSNVLANGGKSYHSYTQPSYVHNTVGQWKGDKTELEAIGTKAYARGSRWLKHLLGTTTDLNGDMRIGREEDRDVEYKRNIDKVKVGLSTSFKSTGKNDGTDVKEQKYVDALNESVVKTLGHRALKKTYAQTLIPADKGRKIEIEGMPTFDSMIDFKDGQWVISDESKDVFIDYFEAEYNRMQEAYGELQTWAPNKLVAHYHTGNKNAFKSQLFPELSPENMDKTSVLFATLYDSDGLPLGREDGKYTITGFTEEQKMAIKEVIEETIKRKLNEAVKDFDAATNIHVGPDGITNISVDESILKFYEEQGYTDPMRALIADHFMNSAINTIEYNKMFLGDPAYFKNMPDMIKRTPASYTDGLPMYLEGITTTKDPNTGEDIQSSDEFFNQATIESPIIGSKYIDLLRASVKDKKIAEFYSKGINMADAQAWITPDRWKFIKTRLGQWTPQHEVVFAKMMSGAKMTQPELKLAAQPLKGVYFEINNNTPTYLKYSQAVLIPQLIQDGEMKQLFDKMTKGPDGKVLPYDQQVHEVVTFDGIKVGAIAPTTIHEADGSFKKEFELNPAPMKNRGWKLQQDLPTKTIHPTMVGSQIQKNILAGIDISTETGRQLYKDINETISALSNMGKANLTEKFKITEENGKMKIGDKEKLYSSLIAEYKRNGGNDNVVAALEKEMPFDAIPQVRGKVENIFMSMMNKELTSIYTSGGSFVQVSPFGLESGHDMKSRNAGIKIVSKNYDPKGLKPPHKDAKTGEYMPGQCFLPYSSLIKLLPRDKAADYTKMSGEELMKLIDPEALKIIGYRIPNQGMSSNDCMEVVGILPEGCGDQIVAYDSVPAKTGSDFDIDKMYMMVPHMFFNKKTNRVEKIPSDLTVDQIKEFGLDPTKAMGQAMQNKLIGLYEQTLLSETAYDKVMTTIDGEFLKTDIVGDKNKRGLYPEVKLNNLDFYSPAFQMRTRFEYLSGKVGVAQTANQLVDHVLNRNLDMRLKEYIGVGMASGEDTMLDPEYDTEGRHLVADAVSAFLNAYVDIAKDPYISRCNHNNTTAGVTFLLLRSGVPLEWVNRFIGQPVLKELVEAIKNNEGITSDTLMVDGKRVTPVQYVAHKYKLDLSVEHSPADVSRVYAKGETHLEKMIHDTQDGKEVSQDAQRDVLKAFIYLQTRAKELNQSTTASKTPDFGDFGQLLSAKNKFLNVVEEGKVIGFTEKFTDTMTGTYKRNGIDWVQQLAKDNNLFITSNPTLEGTANSISSRVGKGERITDEEMIKSISSSFYSYLMSGFKLFENNRKEVPKLFTILPEQIMAMKETNDNFLIQELEVRDSGLYSYIKINSKNKPKTYTNKIVRAWSDLLRSSNPDEVQLAVRLARYAYSQSGLKNNLNQFYRYIPHELLLSMGINEYINKAHNEMSGLDTDAEFRDQMFRHSSDDRNLVPEISLGDVQVAEEGTYVDAGFIYSPKEKNKLQTGVNKNGFETYPEFVALAGDYMDDGERGENTLYKLMGSINIIEEQETGEPKLVSKPVYVRTYKLGTKSNHGSIFEYQRDTKVTKSIIQANNLNPSELEKQKELIQQVMSRDSFLPAEHMLDPHEANKMTEEQLAEIQQKEKEVKVEQKSTTLATGKKQYKGDVKVGDTFKSIHEEGSWLKVTKIEDTFGDGDLMLYYEDSTGKEDSIRLQYFNKEVLGKYVEKEVASRRKEMTDAEAKALMGGAIEVDDDFDADEEDDTDDIESPNGCEVPF